MRKYKDVTYTSKHLDSITCDHCKQVFQREDHFDNTKTFEVNKFTLKWEKGDRFPEGGMGTKISVDLCHKCREQLLEHLRFEKWIGDAKEEDIDY